MYKNEWELNYSVVKIFRLMCDTPSRIGGNDG